MIPGDTPNSGQERSPFGMIPGGTPNSGQERSPFGMIPGDTPNSGQERSPFGMIPGDTPACRDVTMPSTGAPLPVEDRGRPPAPDGASQ